MKRTPLKRGTKTLKKSGFKRKTYEEAIQTQKKNKKRSTGKIGRSKAKSNGKLKRDLMPARVKRAKNKLVKLSHDFIRARDSISEDRFHGYCIDCGKYAEGGDFQCGHFTADSVGGAILRYHPHNMHGQAKGCNMLVRQEEVKINYTFAMVEKYGRNYVDFLRNLKQKTIKADIIFYEKMIELYQKGIEEDIVEYLHSL